MGQQCRSHDLPSRKGKKIKKKRREKGGKKRKRKKDKEKKREKGKKEKKGKTRGREQREKKGKDEKCFAFFFSLNFFSFFVFLSLFVTVGIVVFPLRSTIWGKEQIVSDIFKISGEWRVAENNKT